MYALQHRTHQTTFKRPVVELIKKSDGKVAEGLNVFFPLTYILRSYFLQFVEDIV